MRALPKTIESIDDEMAAVYRALSPARRLQIASEMFSSARHMIETHLQTEYPTWTPQQIHRETTRRLSHGAY